MGESPRVWLVEEKVRRLLLGPGGGPIGDPPARPKGKVRKVHKGKKEAEELFGELRKLGRNSPVADAPDLQRTELPGLGFVSYRPVSRSGPPTIDTRVNISGLENVKFKFVGA